MVNILLQKDMEIAEVNPPLHSREKNWTIIARKSDGKVNIRGEPETLSKFGFYMYMFASPRDLTGGTLKTSVRIGEQLEDQVEKEIVCLSCLNRDCYMKFVYEPRFKIEIPIDQYSAGFSTPTGKKRKSISTPDLFITMPLTEDKYLELKEVYSQIHRVKDLPKIRVGIQLVPETVKAT